MRIAVYDEIRDDAHKIKEQLVNVFQKINIEEKITIDIYTSAVAILDYITKQQRRYDLYAIALNEAYDKGIQLGIRVCEEQKSAKIVFVSEHESHLKCIDDIILIRPYSLVQKPITYDKVFLMMKNIIRNINQNDDSVVLKNKNGIYILANKQITYIESNNRYLMFYRDGKEPIKIIGTFEKIEKQLNKDFVRCHRSYLVNCSRIIKLNKKIIQLDNDVNIPVSSSNYESVYKRFVEIHGKVDGII